MPKAPTLVLRLRESASNCSGAATAGHLQIIDQLMPPFFSPEYLDIKLIGVVGLHQSQQSLRTERTCAHHWSMREEINEV